MQTEKNVYLLVNKQLQQLKKLMFKKRFFKLICHSHIYLFSPKNTKYKKMQKTQQSVGSPLGWCLDHQVQTACGCSLELQAFYLETLRVHVVRGCVVCFRR